MSSGGSLGKVSERDENAASPRAEAVEHTEIEHLSSGLSLESLPSSSSQANNQLVDEPGLWISPASPTKSIEERLSAAHGDGCPF